MGWLALLVALAVVSGPCQTEDSENCTWDAAERGNGQGHSFVNIFGSQFDF